MDAQTAVGDAAVKRAKPQPGTSLLVCIECGEISTIAPDWSVRRLTEDEARALPPDVVGMLAQVEDARRAVLYENGRSPFPTRRPS